MRTHRWPTWPCFFTFPFFFHRNKNKADAGRENNGFTKNVVNPPSGDEERTNGGDDDDEDCDENDDGVNDVRMFKQKKETVKRNCKYQKSLRIAEGVQKRSKLKS